MPGLFGLIKEEKNQNRNLIESLLENADYENLVKDEIFNDENILATRLHLGIIGEKSSPTNIDNNLYIWLHGEVYNLDELKRKFKIEANNFSTLLGLAHSQKRISELLAETDGYFAAVLYDKTSSKIFLISDRYGLKPLYYQTTGSFIWSSELRAYKKLSEINLNANLDLAAIQYFIENGQFIGDRTYFRNIKLLNASTIITYDIKSKRIFSERYWNWSNIRQKEIAFDEATDELYRLLKKSVEQCIKNKDPNDLGLTLSGGIDSRVLLSLIQKKITTITFGTKNCIDFIVAKKVAERNSNPHYFFELNQSNWLNGRIDSIWLTDGMFNMQHMHSSPFGSEFTKYLNVNINGFAGDLNVGGGWISKLNSRISNDSIKHKFGDISDFLDYNDPFYEIPHEDPFYLDVRVRRFTNGGTIQNSNIIEQIKPFYTNDIMDFIYSIPDEYRENGLLYKTMILKHMNQLFKSIHTTHNIYPLGKENDLIVSMKLKIKHAFMKLGVRPNYQWKYTDYEQWFYDSEFTKLKQRVIKQSQLQNIPNYSGYKDLINTNLLLSIKQIEQAFAFVTAEIWLQKFFNKETYTE